MRNYEVLRNDDAAVAIKFNQRAYNYSLAKNQKLMGDMTLAFNINYSYLGKPIGLLAYNGLVVKNIISHETNDLRPCYCIYKDDSDPNIVIGSSGKDSIPLTKIVAQAGPWLVMDGENVVNKFVKHGKFRDDAIRKTKHVSIGIKGTSGTKKSIVLYSANWSMDDIAKYFIDNGCSSAMKFDGGHVAALRFNPDGDDKDNKPIWVGNTGITPIQIYTVSKKTK